MKAAGEEEGGRGSTTDIYPVVCPSPTSPLTVTPDDDGDIDNDNDNNNDNDNDNNKDNENDDDNNFWDSFLFLGATIAQYTTK